MIQTMIDLNLYHIDELTENARQKAIEEMRIFLLSTMRPDDFISGDPTYDTPEELLKAYNAEYNYIENNDDTVIENIEANDYLYFADGNLANVKYKTVNQETKRYLILYNMQYEF